IEMLVVRPMWDRGATMFAIILATLAAQIMIERITILTAGDQPRTFAEFTAGGPLKIGAIAVSYQLFWILGCGALMAALLWLFFAKTRTGRALRACAQNREAAALIGIPVGRMLMVSFALSAALGAVAGILVTPTQYTAFNVGVPFGIYGFIAAIIGGFGSASGALAGGVLLGAIQALAIVTLGAGYKNVAALSILLAGLLLFPNGVLSGRSAKEGGGQRAGAAASLRCGAGARRQREARVAVRRDIVADLPVGRHAADIGQEHARLARNVRAHVPGRGA